MFLGIPFVFVILKTAVISESLNEVSPAVNVWGPIFHIMYIVTLGVVISACEASYNITDKRVNFLT